MPEPDPIMVRIAAGVALGARGDRPGARAALEKVWVELGPDDRDALRRVAVAHAMADVQDDPQDVLTWDERALDAAAHVTPEQMAEAGVATSVQGLYPSLHLNLADAHHRLGEAAAARQHVAEGRRHLDALAADGYAAMISDALSRIEASLDAAEE